MIKQQIFLTLLLIGFVISQDNSTATTAPPSTGNETTTTEPPPSLPPLNNETQLMMLIRSKLALENVWQGDDYCQWISFRNETIPDFNTTVMMPTTSPAFNATIPPTQIMPTLRKRDTTAATSGIFDNWYTLNVTSYPMAFVGCSNGSVTEIVVANTNLGISEIPSEIFSLTQLAVLAMVNCSISIPIPSDIFNSKNLLLVDLSHNQLTVDSNSFISEETNYNNSLLIANFAHNMIQGQLPAFLFHSNIILLDLSWNELTGELSESLFWSNSSLMALDVSHNLLSGPLNASILENSQMIYFDASSNNFDGNFTSDLLDNNPLLLFCNVQNNSFSVCNAMICCTSNFTRTTPTFPTTGPTDTNTNTMTQTETNPSTPVSPTLSQTETQPTPSKSNANSSNTNYFVFIIVPLILSLAMF